MGKVGRQSKSSVCDIICVGDNSNCVIICSGIKSEMRAEWIICGV